MARETFSGYALWEIGKLFDDFDVGRFMVAVERPLTIKVMLFT